MAKMFFFFPDFQKTFTCHLLHIEYFLDKNVFFFSFPDFLLPPVITLNKFGVPLAQLDADPLATTEEDSSTNLLSVIMDQVRSTIRNKTFT